MNHGIKTPLATVDGWYQAVNGDWLEVLAIDDDSTIAVQYYDGTVAEFDLVTWHEAIVGRIPPPDDFGGSLELSQEEYGINTDFAVSSTYADVRQSLDWS